MLIMAQLPAFRDLDVIVAVSTLILCFFTIVAIILAVVQGGGTGASYTILGSSIAKVMNG